MSESHQQNMVQEAIQQVTVTNSQPVRERDKEIIKTERRGPTSAGMHWQMGFCFLFFGSPFLSDLIQASLPSLLIWTV